MKIVATAIPDVLILEPQVFGDDRGFFFESFNQKVLQKIGISDEFVQDNHSRSIRSTLRGLHYQAHKPQGKLVRVVAGAVFDVVVDLRKSSETFGKWVGVELNEDNKRIMWVPKGFAHGFLVLSESADFLYKASDFYSPEDERCIAWNDPRIGIEWPLVGDPLLSTKDKNGVQLSDAEVFE